MKQSEFDRVLQLDWDPPLFDAEDLAYLRNADFSGFYVAYHEHGAVKWSTTNHHGHFSLTSQGGRWSILHFCFECAPGACVESQDAVYVYMKGRGLLRRYGRQFDAGAWLDRLLPAPASRQSKGVDKLVLGLRLNTAKDARFPHRGLTALPCTVPNAIHDGTVAVRHKTFKSVLGWLEARVEAGIPQSDDMLILLRSMDREFDGSEARLSLTDAASRLSLERLLDLGAVLLAENDDGVELVRVGEPVNPTVRWEPADDDTLSLCVLDDDDNDLTKGVFRLGDGCVLVERFKDGLWLRWVVSSEYELGVLLSAANVPIAAEDVHSVRQVLNERGDARLPLPPPPIGTKVIRPKPRAIVTTEPAPKKGKPAHGRVRVRFEYDGHDLSGGRRLFATVKGDGEDVVEIHRDLAEEARVHGTLKDAGLALVESEGPGYVFETGAPASPARTAVAIMEPLQALGIDVRNSALEAYTLLEPDEEIGLALSDAADGGHRVQVIVRLEGVEVDLLELIAGLLADGSLSLTPIPGEDECARIPVEISRGRIVPLSLGAVRKILEPIADLLATNLKRGRLVVRGSALLAIQHAQSEHGFRVKADSRAADLFAILREPQKEVPPPTGMTGTFWEHQYQGYQWLALLSRCGFGGLLADDTSLGKTLQVLSHILHEKESGRLNRPVLIVAKVVAVEHWIKNASTFTPGLTIANLSGPWSPSRLLGGLHSDIILTTYGQFVRRRDDFLTKRYALLVLDEPEDCSNPRNHTWQTARDILAPRKIPISATPLDNSLSQVWALLELAEPGCLGSLQRFRDTYIVPIEVNKDGTRLDELRRRLGPLILRRRRSDVSKSLPSVVTQTVEVDLTGDHRVLYETIRAPLEREVRDIIRIKGLQRAKGDVFRLIQSLRALCCSAELLRDKHPNTLGDSEKETAFYDLVSHLHSEGRYMVVFSYFESMHQIIARRLTDMGIASLTISGKSGSAQAREKLRTAFNAGEVQVLLVTIKAGKSAMELQKADTVIFYDKWWTASAIQQAVDRVAREGQVNEHVTVYSFEVRNSIETHMNRIAAKKGELADALLDGRAFESATMTEDDLLALIAPLPPVEASLLRA